MSAPQTLNLRGVLSETSRIINAYSRHFLSLSVLFLLPLSFSVVIYPFLFYSTSITTHYHRSVSFFQTESPPIDKFQLIFPILYAVLTSLLSLFATASITYSTFHGFYGRPVKFVSSLKSVLFSFFPLIGTLIIAKLILALVFFGFGCFALLVYYGAAYLGVEMDYSSNGSVYFMFLLFLMACLLIWILVFFQIEWCLMSVVVIVESQWGYSAIKRSTYLVKGMKKVVFFMMLLFGILLGILSMLCSSLMPNGVEFGTRWAGWACVTQMVVYASLMTILMLYNVAANVVLYMYCKASHGELAFDIAEEFAREYVSLPYDDGKVPHVVYVV